jgi:hypothetical protein
MSIATHRIRYFLFVLQSCCMSFSRQHTSASFNSRARSLQLFPRLFVILGLALACGLATACSTEDHELPENDINDAELPDDVDVYTEPYREPVYELLAEDDPNRTCCYVQVMRFLAESEPGGRRACDVDPQSGPTIPCSYPDEWELKTVGGCPVFVLKENGLACTPGLDD